MALIVRPRPASLLLVLFPLLTAVSTSAGTTVAAGASNTGGNAKGQTAPFRPKSVVIGPKTAGAGKSDPWGFRLVKGQQSGTLSLSFFSRDRRLHFDSSGPFVIQLNMSPVIQVEPSVITGTEWPKTDSPLTLKLSGAAAGKLYPIAGAAAYTLCGPGPKECRKVKTEIRYVVGG